MNDLSKMTYRELDAVFAQEVAGVPEREIYSYALPNKDISHFVDHYSTSLDALMPFVEALPIEMSLDVVRLHKGKWLAVVCPAASTDVSNGPIREKLPRAVAEALIQFKRTQLTSS